MSNIKDQLIKLGSVRPELRPHIRPVLAELNKTAATYQLKSSLKAPAKIAQKYGLKPPVLESLELSEKWGLTGFMVFGGLDSGYDDPSHRIPSLMQDLSRALPSFNLSIYDEDGDDLIVEFNTK